MRILHIECNLDATVGGSHQALFDLVVGMHRDRYQPVVLFNRTNPFVGRLRELGFEVHDYGPIVREEGEVRRRGGPGKWWDMVQGVRRRLAFLRTHRIQLLHVINNPGGDPLWPVAARLARLPAVASAMGRGADGVSPLGRAPGTVSVLRSAVYRMFDRVLPVSQVIADRWMALGVPPDRLRVVHHGVDLGRIRSRRTRGPAEVRKELSVPDGGLLAVMASNVRRWKGQHVVLEALSRLEPALRRRLRVVFAGAVSERDDAYLRELEEYVNQFNLGESVEFLGFRDDLPNLLGACDIAIHASTQIEPGGIVVLEAMALGAAVIASSLGGHTEVMRDDTGLTFDPSDPEELTRHLTTLCLDGELRERLGRAAAARMGEFSVERNVELTEAVYDELLG